MQGHARVSGAHHVQLHAWASLPLLWERSFAAFKAYTYSQLEYITAAMLTRHVPRAEPLGPTVVQVGGGTKELFYYPSNTSKVRTHRQCCRRCSCCLGGR
jgi:hypothetical protein